MKSKHSLTIAKMEEALRASGGIVTMAARRLQCHRTTIYRWLDRHPKLAEAKNEITEEVGDLVESGLIELIRAKDPATLRWYAELKLKDRGYTRRVENIGAPIDAHRHPDLSQLSNEELMILHRVAGRYPQVVSEITSSQEAGETVAKLVGIAVSEFRKRSMRTGNEAVA